jgi:hypothetical protein
MWTLPPPFVSLSKFLSLSLILFAAAANGIITLKVEWVR